MTESAAKHGVSALLTELTAQNPARKVLQAGSVASTGAE